MPPRKTTTETTTPPKLSPRAQADADAPGPTARAFADLGLSEPWMREWAGLALRDGGPGLACARVAVAPADFAAARRRDRAFDGLCRDLDRVVDATIADTLRTGAVRGDARAQSLYHARARILVLPPEDPDAAPPLPASVAAAMISAGLAAAEALAPPPTPSTLRAPSLAFMRRT